MRNLELIASVFSLLLFASSSRAQSQLEMNPSATHAYQKADSELNVVYRQILVGYKSDTSFVKACKEAQLNMKYPDEGEGYYGSVLPMCEANYLEELTRERIKTLRQWIVGAEEGDVCSGSIKLRDESK